MLQVRDSSFLFGTAGSGDATVTIDGQPARVWPNGAWLAYVALPLDSLIRLRIEARRGADLAVLEYPVRRRRARRRPVHRRRGVARLPVARAHGPALARAWRVPYARRPGGRRRAAVRLRLADGTILPLSPQPQPLEVPAAVRAFERDTARLRTPVVRDRYVGLVRGRALGPDPGVMLPVVTSPMPAISEARCHGHPRSRSRPPPATASGPSSRRSSGTDTARARWPLQVAMLDTLPVAVELDDDSTGTGITDSMTVGRAVPGGTYAWFFPTGTRAAVTGRRNDDVRLRLSHERRGLGPRRSTPARSRPAGPRRRRSSAR